jgi:hypothetical protein
MPRGIPNNGVRRRRRVARRGNDDIRVVHKDAKDDAFIVKFWDNSPQHLQSHYGVDTSQRGIKAIWRENMWSGRVEHVQSGDATFFRNIVDLLAFMQNHKKK